MLGNDNKPRKDKEVEASKLLKYEPRIPYAAKVRKDQQNKQLNNYLNMFKALHINVPFVEALARRPHYGKILKEVLPNKRKLEEVSTVTLSEECSAVLTNQLLKKEKDPRSFIVPCTIGGVVNEKALADLGASFKLMPYKIFEKLVLGELKPMTMTLQIADRSIRHPRGIIEDV